MRILHSYHDTKLGLKGYLPVHWSSEGASSAHQVFFGQSAFLHSHYHYVQILVHRPFIPNPGSTLPGSAIPSLTICTNAARRMTRILSIFCQRTLSLAVEGEPAWLPPLTEVHNALLIQYMLLADDAQYMLFVSGIVLMFEVWIKDNRRNLEDVELCLKTTRLIERREPRMGKVTYRILLLSILCYR